MNLSPQATANIWLEKAASVWIFPAVTLLLVLTTVAGVRMQDPMILSILVAGVVCLGLPHGSLDPMVARKFCGTNRHFTMARFLAAYSLLAALCAVGWLADPAIALPIFLLISAAHFGSDWKQRGKLWGRIAYGACVVTVPALHHAEPVRRIFLSLGAANAGEVVLYSRIIACIAITVASLSLLPQVQDRWRDVVELAILLVGGLVLDPLVFFICYFCLLHSPRHLTDTAREVGLHRISAIATTAAPSLIASLFLATVLWHFLPEGKSGDRVIEIVFIGLAGLTVPHMLLTEITGLTSHNQKHGG